MVLYNLQTSIKKADSLTVFGFLILLSTLSISKNNLVVVVVVVVVVVNLLQFWWSSLNIPLEFRSP